MNESGYLSCPDARCSIERVCFEEGRAKGVSIFSAHNAAGLDFQVLIDRGMDLGNVRVKGSLVNFISATGVTHPAYFEPEGTGWLRSFSGGLMTTCGYRQVGEPCEEDDERLGLHGRIANLPAEQICSEVQLEGGRFVGRMRGMVRETCHQRENLVRSRTIWFEEQTNAIHLHDEISNRASFDSPFLVAYHLNFGFPFLTEATRLFLPAEWSVGWDAYSEQRVSEFGVFSAPEDHAKDVLLLHRLRTEASGNATVLLSNENLGVKITYPTQELPYLAQWKLPRRRDYVLGIEPCNNQLRGRRWEREHGTLRMLEPDETVSLDLTIAFLDAAEVDEAVRTMNTLKENGE